MKQLVEAIKAFKTKNSYNDSLCASKLGLTEEVLKGVLDGSIKLGTDECDRINEIIEGKSKFNSKKFIKLLDLIFRLVAMVMAVTVLMLCINGVAETETLIVLLSVGVVCSSLTILPRIEK